VKEVEEYRRKAEECRRMLKLAANAEQRRKIERIARTWEDLAEARFKAISRARNGERRSKPRK
jgi:hypothetical protein